MEKKIEREREGEMGPFLYRKNMYKIEESDKFIIRGRE